MWRYFILGVIQGITEILPISSSGHLNLISNILYIDERLFIFVLLHFASCIAIIIFFRGEIYNLVKYFPKVIFKLVPAVLITGIGGFFLKKHMENIYNNLLWTSLGFITNGIILLSTKFFYNQSRQMKDITWLNSLSLGIIQILAILPGISRSGLTISFLLWSKFDFRSAFSISFLVGIPIIIGASLISFSKDTLSVSNVSFTILSSTMVIVFIFSLVSLWTIYKLLQKRRFHFWGYYSLGIGLLTILKLCTK